MARHLVHSFVLAAVLSPFVNAGPCKPSPPTSSTAVLATTTPESSAATGSATLSGSTTLSGSSTETSVTISESGSSTATSLAATTTESTCSIEDHPVYTDPFYASYTASEGLPDATTTTAAATSTAGADFQCQDNLKNPAPKGLMCAEAGNAQGFSNGWRYMGGGPADSLMNCYKACMETQNCQTIMFQENQFCELYRGTVTSVDDECNDYDYYDIDCFCETDVTRAPTCEYSNPIKNGDWGNGRLEPWVLDPNSERDPIDVKIVPGGQDGSGYRLQTANFHADKSMWLYQDIEACPGARFHCTYYWWWDKYYGIRQTNGNKLVPYLRIYEGDYNVVGNRWPESDDDTQRWVPAEIYFTMPSSGRTTIWYIASSPQGEWINTSEDPCKANWVHRPNAFRMSSMSCTAY
ncbi:hypothetical protein F53441_11179 [Fusarium austroafricanum]|uniref:Apple domain-containing protein n=1 Tax=Fusarium austroafricanum TaxID=2364996 RepID=A0A8H4NTZ1_9HYPO|nr:hypothetical protein F53441_11179 [Fusarium austroafricanum]